jgi:hypothetical protein
MAYIEFLRVRTRLLWFVGLLLVFVSFTALSAHGGGGVHVSIQNGGSDVSGGVGTNDTSGAPGGANTLAAVIPAIPADALFVAVGLLTLIFGSIVGPSLNREWDTLDFAWTQPISRARLALTYIGVDAAGIACAFVLAFGCSLVPLAAVGVVSHIAVQPDTLEVALVGLGSAFMWYAILQAASAWYAGRAAGLVQGLSWAGFTILLALGTTQAFGPLFHAAVLALNCLNPLAYVSSLSIHPDGAVTEGSVLPLSMGIRAALVWALGLAACAVAVAGWKRLEL